ncbi:ferritin heavy polypeptide-like 17E [Arvicanthis niloticus]|uniref:ferritin heavy polypeptide-like 17E n=1 Tax=Arvicanthis niloticus TaxID=61156 RepID=UPI0014867BDA|nr:ferritin heavy polypeptide-like 17 [Arvicanthis niloticus]XP_034342046.1 ferritin heavy polypeptide-like 17 [Arvicanthis niloticus]
MAEAPSQVRQNYDSSCEDAVNTHIRLLLYASYVYLSMAFYFDRDDVALENFKRFFLSKSHNCKATVEMFVFLQNKRGGHAILPSIAKPDRSSWQGGLQAMECSFCMEMTINQSLLDLHKLAKGKGDAHLCDFLEQHCLEEQVSVLKKMGGYLTNLRQMGAPEKGLAEYLFDKLSLP